MKKNKQYIILVSEFTNDLALTKKAFIKHMEALRKENLEHFEDYHLDSHKYWDTRKIKTMKDAKLYFIEAMQGDNYSQFYKINFDKKIVSSIIRNTANDKITYFKNPLIYSKDEIKKEFSDKYKKNFFRTDYLQNEFNFMSNQRAL